MAGNKLEKLIQLEQKVGKLKDREIEKALSSSDPNELIKAHLAFQKQVEARQDHGHKAYLVDPNEFQSSFGYKDRPVNLSYNMLKGMARVPVINAVIKTRINQVAAFCEPQKNEYSVGYVIRKRKLPGENSPTKMTKDERQEIYDLQDFMENCGETNVWGADDFDAFCRKIIRDSLVFDQMTFEVERDRRGKPVAFYAVDASTMRLSESFDDQNYEQYKNTINVGTKIAKVQNYYPSYAQILDGSVHELFYPWEMCFGIRNPTTDVTMSGYGVSELEELVSVVTSLVWGEEYNRRFFKQGSAPKGILRISGSMPDHKLNEFRQNWNSTMRGVQNAHRTPVLEAEKADWIDLQRNNRDMEFTQWMEFLIKVACAIYTIDPSEINFPMSGSAGSSPMFGENKESTLKFSQMKGLYPILKFLQKRINKYLIQPRNPKYEFAFVGLDAMTPKEQAELDEKSVKTYKTVNELRKEKNLKPLPGGDILLDSTFARAVNAEKQRQMMDDSQGYEDGGAGAEEAIISGKYPGGEAEEELDKNNPIIKSLEEFLIGINTK
jgi:hypothetical protein